MGMGGYGMNNLMLDMLFPRWGFGYSPYYGYYGRNESGRTEPENLQAGASESRRPPTCLATSRQIPETTRALEAAPASRSSTRRRLAAQRTVL